MTISLADLLTPATRDSVLAQELAIAGVVGLTTTAWQKLGIARTIYVTMAQEFADNSVTITFIAQGGYASLAAQMVDANGNPVTTWMDLISLENYNNTRIPATFAETDATGFAVTNSSGTSYNNGGPGWGPGELHFSNSTTGAKYHNTAAVAVIASVLTTGIAIAADVAGSGGSASPGQIDTLDTPLVGVTCSNSATLAGSDAETNPQLLVRDQAKLGSLSPNGAAKAYEFVAKSILDSTQPFYNPALSQAITRTNPITGAGTVDLYIANDAGAPSTPDLNIVDAAIQAWAVPLGVTTIVHKATNLVIPVTYTAYIPSAASVTTGAVSAAVASALIQLFKDLPIGGTTDATPNVVPVETIRGTIFAAIVKLVPAYAARVSVTLAAPAADVAVATTEVPKLGTVTPTVILT